jgi:hypothetical protein
MVPLAIASSFEESLKKAQYLAENGRSKKKHYQ